MNEEDKKKYADHLQKNLTKACYSKCSQNQKSIHQCFEVCYEKYLRTVNTVNSMMKENAYSKHSIIGYKGYPEHSIESLMNLSRTMVDTLDYTPFAIQHQSRA